MNTDILNTELLWGVSIWRLVLSALFVFVGLLGRKIVRYVFRKTLRKKTEQTAVLWDDDLVELLPAPVGVTLLFISWYAATWFLGLPTYPIDLGSIVFGALEVAIAISLTWIVFRLVDMLDRILSRVASKTASRMDDQLVPLVRKTLKVFAGIIVGVMIVQNLGVNVTSVLASIGLGGLAFALAAKDTVANFFGSLIIFTDQPFQIGDWVGFQNIEGVVEEVGFRTTRIRSFDDALVIVPNQAFTSSEVINYTNMRKRRLRFVVGLSYESSPDDITQFVGSVKEFLHSRADLEENSRSVYFQALGESALEVVIQAYATVTGYAQFMEIQQEILLKVLQLASDQNLEIAFPTRTLQIKAKGLTLTDNSSGNAI